MIAPYQARACLVILYMITAIVMSSLSALGAPVVYKNDEFGMQLVVSSKLKLCFSPKDEHDEGMSAFFSEKAICGQFVDQRFIGVSFSYNVTDETATLDDFVDWVCGRKPGSTCIKAPTHLAIDKFPSKARLIKYNDGWVDVKIVAQAWTNKNVSQRPFVNYEITLHTTPEYLQQDLRELRIVLRSVKTWSPFRTNQ